MSKTFKILTIETVVTRREYFIDAEDEIAARAEWSASLSSDADFESKDDERITLVIETDSDGNELAQAK